MAITMLRKKPAGEIKELDEKAVDDFLDSASHVKKEANYAHYFRIPFAFR